MEQQLFLEELLCYEKNICDIYLHGTIESTNKKIYDVFSKNLFDSLELQHSIYKLMEELKYYDVCNVESKVLNKAKNKLLSK